MKVKELKIGNKAFRKKDRGDWFEWIEFEVNETYLPLIKEFPEDYRVNHPTKEIIQDYQKRNRLLKILEINKSGYAGILSNGNIVDRREHPEAIPVQENRLLNIPKPKPLNK